MIHSELSELTPDEESEKDYLVTFLGNDEGIKAAILRLSSVSCVVAGEFFWDRLFSADAI
jgi:hypothetical protein